MNKRARQYVGLLTAIVAYYIIHEGAHLVYAVLTDTFRQVNFMGLGVQIDIYAERLTDGQLALFCLVGSAATLFCAYILVALSGRIANASSRTFMACMYYVTIAMMLLDPLYLSILCGFFGGGDMNGISLLLPEIAARIIYGVVLAINAAVFLRVVLPRYTAAFSDKEQE